MTGANGFLGQHLVQHLLDNKIYEVHVLIRSPRNCAELLELDVIVHQGDICCAEDVELAFKVNYDLVFHLAAVIGYVSFLL